MRFLRKDCMSMDQESQKQILLTDLQKYWAFRRQLCSFRTLTVPLMLIFWCHRGKLDGRMLYLQVLLGMWNHFQFFFDILTYHFVFIFWGVFWLSSRILYSPYFKCSHLCYKIACKNSFGKLWSVVQTFFNCIGQRSQFVYAIFPVLNCICSIFSCRSFFNLS